jgi:hypothetical protein
LVSGVSIVFASRRVSKSRRKQTPEAEVPDLVSCPAHHMLSLRMTQRNNYQVLINAFTGHLKF